MKALVAAVRVAPPAPDSVPLEALVASSDVDELVELVLAERLAGAASENLSRLVSPEHASILRAECELERLRHSAYLLLLDRLAAALAQADIAWLALKGPVLAEVAWRDLPRGYTDLDLMVPARRLPDAVRALGSVGVSLADQDWAGMAQRIKGELSLSISGLPLVDLHWHPVYLRSARERWRIPTEELLARRRPLRLKQVEAWVLDPEDLTAHVALHASFSSVQQLRRLLDIERTVATCSPNWEVLVQRCCAWQVGLPVGVMLNRARITLGAAVPEQVIDELLQGPLSRLLGRQLGQWSPSGHLPGKRSIKNGVTRCLRDSMWATASALALDSSQQTAALLWSRLAPIESRASITYHGDNAEGFKRYFTRVAKTNRYGHLNRPGIGDCS